MSNRSWVGEFQEGMAFVSKSIYCIIDEKGENVFSGDSEFFISAFSYDSEYDIIPGYIFKDEAMKMKKYGLMGLAVGAAVASTVSAASEAEVPKTEETGTDDFGFVESSNSDGFGF